ncbi:MAG: AI-2E family transporter [Bacillota bacterium]
METYFRVSLKVWRLVFAGLLLVIALYFLLRVRAILAPFIIAVVLAYLLDPFVCFLEKRGFTRSWSIIIIYLTLGLLLFLMVFFGLPAIIKELYALGDIIPRQIMQMQHWVQDFNRDYQETAIPFGLRQLINETLGKVENGLMHIARQLASGLVGLMGHIFSLIIAPIFTFYLLKDQENICRRLVAVMPITWRSEILALWEQIDIVLIRFIQGNLLVAFLVGMMTFLGLSFLGMDFALVLGLVAGLAELIPYFGAIIGAIPILALALLKSKMMLLYVALVMLVIEQIESNILTPKILGESVGLHPLVVIFSIMAGGYLFGVVGVLAAVPVTAVLRILINYLFLKLLG